MDPDYIPKRIKLGEREALFAELGQVQSHLDSLQRRKIAIWVQLSANIEPYVCRVQPSPVELYVGHVDSAHSQLPTFEQLAAIHLPSYFNSARGIQQQVLSSAQHC